MCATGNSFPVNGPMLITLRVVSLIDRVPEPFGSFAMYPLSMAVGSMTVSWFVTQTLLQVSARSINRLANKVYAARGFMRGG